MPDVPISIVAGTLPVGAVYNPQSYFNAIVARMTATISAGNILFGQLGGSEPNGPLPPGGAQPGLWFGGADGGQGYWNDWNSNAAKYLPIRNVCGQYINGNLRLTDFVCGAKSANTTLMTPDQSGTLALISDLPEALGTQSYSGETTLPIDWAGNRAPVYVILGASLNVTFSSTPVDGEQMDFWLENNTGVATPIPTLNITGAIWDNGGGTATAPALSAGLAGARIVDHVRVYRVGGLLFASLIQKNYKILTTQGHVTPAFVSALRYPTPLNKIDSTMSAVLAGGSLDATKWKVNINGTDFTPQSAVSSGTTATVIMSTANPLHAS